MKPSFDIVQRKADQLGFTMHIMSAGKYKVLHKDRTRGYIGNLDCCVAYLQGCEEERSRK